MMKETAIIISAVLLVLGVIYLETKKKKHLRTNCRTIKNENKMKKPSKSKRSKSRYTSLFIANSDIRARSGKLVYIRPEFHERLSKIVQVIGNNEITLFSYVDNVLAQHFDEYHDEIVREYEKNQTDIF